MKALKIIITVIIILIIVLFISFQVFFRLPLADYQGTIELAGLKSDVEVRFDKYGVPHIFAQNEADLFFAQGYITARDRMFQMDVTRLAGRGELSTLFGERTIDTDKYLKTIGFYRIARAEYKSLTREMKDIMAAYVAGVNAYIDTVEHLPREYIILGAKPEPWRPEDSIVAGTLMAYSLSQSGKDELIYYQLRNMVSEEKLHDLLPVYPDCAPTISPESTRSSQREGHIRRSDPSTRQHLVMNIIESFLPKMPVSNWMIYGPKKTTTGNALFTGSPDLEPTLPATFYLIRLQAGDYDVAGGSLPGAPGVNVLGCNGQIAWSSINGCTDDLDYFIEKVHPDNPNRYLTESGWRDFTLVKETLKIKTDNGMKEEELIVKISRHGPIISAVMPLAPKNTAMQWVGLKPIGLFHGFMEITRARNFREFRRAVSLMKSPTLNLGYADREGNIGYQYLSAPPRRKKGKGIFPAPGWTGEYDWKGYVPFEELPFDLNPSTGYFGGFNNKPKELSYHLVFWHPFERATRFAEIMKERERITLEDAHAIQLDSISVVAKRWIPLLISAAKGKSEFSRHLALFEDWNFDLSRESAAATLFSSFYYRFMENTFSDEVGKEFWSDHLGHIWKIYHPDRTLALIINENSNPWFDDVSTGDKVEKRDDMLLKSLRESIAELTERLGTDPRNWQWERVHTIIFKHPLGEVLGFLNLCPIPTAGDTFTVGAANWDTTKPYHMVAGGVIRMIVDFSDIEKSTFVSPPGQSGLYMSPHYDDMTEPWADNTQIPMHFLTGRELSDVLLLMKKRE
jgi:penicillin amidase